MDARLRILLLDDDPLVLNALGRLLKPHVVIGLEDPQVALALADPTYVDAILCDGLMPSMNGEEFIEAALLQGFPSSRLALMTGDFDLADRLRDEGREVVQKPPGPGRLEDLVERWQAEVRGRNPGDIAVSL